MKYSEMTWGQIAKQEAKDWTIVLLVCLLIFVTAGALGKFETQTTDNASSYVTIETPLTNQRSNLQPAMTREELVNLPQNTTFTVDK